MRLRSCVAILLILLGFASSPSLAGVGQNTANIRWSVGKQAYDSGNYAGAIAAWTEPTVVKYASDEATYFMWLGAAYCQTGEFEKAGTTVKRGLDLQPKDPAVLSSLHKLLGRANLELKRFDLAVAEAESAIAALPQDAESFLLLSRAQSEAGRYDKAAGAAVRSYELKPSPDACSLAGVANLYLGRPELALQSFQRGLSLNPKDGSARQGAILAQMALLDFSAAEAAAREAAATGLKEGSTLQSAALYYMGRTDEAMAVLQASLAEKERGGIGVRVGLSPQNGIILQEVLPGTPAAEAGLQAGDWLTEVDGQKIIKGAFNLQPLLTLEQLTEKLRGAPGTSVTVKLWHPGKITPFERTLVRRSLAAGKEAALDFGIRALLWRAKGDSEKALADAQKAVSLDKSAYLTAFALGFALADKGQFDAALLAFDEPAVGKPTPLQFAEAHRQVGRALCFAKKGDLEKAADLFFSVADRLDPRCPPAWQDRAAFLALLKPIAQGHVEAAKKLEAEGQVAPSLTEYAQALRYLGDEKEISSLRTALFTTVAALPSPLEMPEEARRHTIRGEVLTKEGDLNGAQHEFAEALRLAPYLAAPYYNAAMLSGQLKRYAEAIRLMTLYLQAAPKAEDARAAKDQIIKWELLAERQK